MIQTYSIMTRFYNDNITNRTHMNLYFKFTLRERVSSAFVLQFSAHSQNTDTDTRPDKLRLCLPFYEQPKPVQILHCPITTTCDDVSCFSCLMSLRSTNGDATVRILIRWRDVVQWVSVALHVSQATGGVCS